MEDFRYYLWTSHFGLFWSAGIPTMLATHFKKYLVKLLHIYLSDLKTSVEHPKTLKSHFL